MKYTIDTIKDLIKIHLNHDVISSEYIGYNELIDIKCYCGEIYHISFRNILKGIKRGTKYHCDTKYGYLTDITCKTCKKIFKPLKAKTLFCSKLCKDSFPRTEESKQKTSDTIRKKFNLPNIILNCKICNIEITTKNQTKCCSKECLKKYYKIDEICERNRLNGQKGGKKSAYLQQRRSKNEIMFAELCKEYFGENDVLCNEPIFDNWDSDVINLSKKVAILWNGIWHYQQIMQSQSLIQVQTRDRIKTTVILNHGYTPYEIKDLGKFNPKFVLEQFQCFIFSLIEIY